MSIYPERGLAAAADPLSAYLTVVEQPLTLRGPAGTVPDHDND